MSIVDPYGGGGLYDADTSNDVANPYGVVKVNEVPMTIRHRRATATTWTSVDFVLDPAEIGYETDTGKFKVGNGESPWSTLDYFIPEQSIRDLIEVAIADLPQAGGGGNVSADVSEHINSLTPHPVYDDGPSLFLLYQNAKA